MKCRNPRTQTRLLTSAESLQLVHATCECSRRGGALLSLLSLLCGECMRARGAMLPDHRSQWVSRQAVAALALLPALLAGTRPWDGPGRKLKRARGRKARLWRGLRARCGASRATASLAWPRVGINDIGDDSA